MSKSSTGLPGHYKTSAARAPFPEPEEVKNDIEALIKWVSAIRKLLSL